MRSHETPRHTRLRMLLGVSATALAIATGGLERAEAQTVSDPDEFFDAVRDATQTPGNHQITVLTGDPLEITRSLWLPGLGNLDLVLEDRTLLVGNADRTGRLNIGNGTTIEVQSTNGVHGIRVGKGTDARGVLNMTGGTITFSAENGFFGLLDIGNGLNAVGRMIQSGGTITTPYAFQVGANGGRGTYVLSGDGVMNLEVGAATYIGLTEDEYKDNVGNSIGMLRISDNAQFVNHGGQLFVGLGGTGIIT